jgi:hypothetical protein
MVKLHIIDVEEERTVMGAVYAGMKAARRAGADVSFNDYFKIAGRYGARASRTTLGGYCTIAGDIGVFPE